MNKPFSFISGSLFLGIGLLLACSPEEPEVFSDLPSACFSTPAKMEAGIAVQFNAACSENASTYYWDFGDGQRSTVENPLHTYGAKGSYEVTLTVSGTDSLEYEYKTTIEIAEAPSSATTTHYWGEMVEDEVWEAGIHIIIGEIEVTDATLTIMPGAIVKFDEEASLRIGTSSASAHATLFAEGTPEQPILFTAYSDSPTKGYYKGIYFGAGDSGESSMTYCTLEYGGFSYGDGQQLSVRETQINFNHNTIRHVKGHGLYLRDGGFHSFDYNTFSDCDLRTVAVTANAVHQLGTHNTYDQELPVEVLSSTLSERAVTWKKQTYPYLISGAVTVGSTEGTQLTIAPGTVFKFLGGMISIGKDVDHKASLIAEGTEAEPILFTSARELPAPGDWGGIHFGIGNNPVSSVQNAILEYGGGTASNYQAALRVTNTSLNVNNCLFRYTAPYAVLLNEEGYFNSFENNTIQNEGSNGIKVYGNWLHTIGTSNEIVADKGIIIVGDQITHEQVSWPRRPFPYHSVGYISVGSETGSTLTIEAGTTILMEAGTSISVGGTQYTFSKGSLIANGTAEEPIFLGTVDLNEEGDHWYWDGVKFYEGTGTGSQLNYCTIDYAGNVITNGGIFIRGTDQPTIINSTVQNSQGYGIVTEGANPVMENNSFINNAMADYYSR